MSKKLKVTGLPAPTRAQIHDAQRRLAAHTFGQRQGNEQAMLGFQEGARWERDRPMGDGLIEMLSVFFRERWPSGTVVEMRHEYGTFPVEVAEAIEQWKRNN